MMPECLGRRRGWRMPIAFLDSGRADGCGVCLEIPRFGSWSWSESKKNGLRRLRSRAQYILRPQDTARTRSFMRGYASVSRGGVPASGVPQLWSCEAGEAELDRRQSVVDQTVCLLCGATMPGVDAERRSQGTALGLADGQEPGDAIHARASPSRGNARAVGDWD
jgi:NAD-dependent dihydropyrimidine dehydrogenase PreA subunit